MEQTVTNLQDITQAYLKSILHYDPETGEWRWRWRDDVPLKWNRRWAGKEAGTISRWGYRIITINWKLYRASRLAFMYMEGEWPPHEAEHKDPTDRSDDRWESLRKSTRSQNLFNRRIQRNNTSGCKGVDWRKRDRTWRVRIKINGKVTVLGYFKRLEDAIARRKAVAEELHGEFVRH
jgi:hypothetical protein